MTAVVLWKSLMFSTANGKGTYILSTRRGDWHLTAFTTGIVMGSKETGTSKASRGGARKGAGRKAVLPDTDDRLSIGRECEKRWRLGCAAAETERRRQVIRADLQKLWEEANAIPVDQRSRWLSDDAGEMHRDDVIGEIRTQNETRKNYQSDGEDDESVYRLLPRGRPPRGLRAQILRAVSSAETQMRGKVVSIRRVEACWKEYRSDEAFIRRELADYVPDVTPPSPKGLISARQKRGSGGVCNVPGATSAHGEEHEPPLSTASRKSRGTKR